VLALLGIPLGLSAKRGGKATGFVLTIVLVFIYYFLSLGGVSLGRLDKISPALGVWLGNIVFFLAGAFLLWRSLGRPLDVNLEPIWQGITSLLRRSRQVGEETRLRLLARRRFAAGFPQILDDYVLREFVLYLLLVLVTFLIWRWCSNFLNCSAISCGIASRCSRYSNIWRVWCRDGSICWRRLPFWSRC
jgi:hypothetical protein